MSLRYYVDGACSGNGTVNATGGYGMVCIRDDDIIDQKQEFFTENVTNNRMELKGILCAINHIHENGYDNEFLIPTIYSDSAYSVNTINDWMYRWANNNWLKSDNKEPENLDLIQLIYNLKEVQGYKFYLEKIKGHANNKWNNYVDSLATGKVKILSNDGRA